MDFALFYLAAGSIAGFLAGLLGVGGGIVIVPILLFVFAAQHFPADQLMHIAVGTSLASVLFTSLVSLRTHHNRGAVKWDIVKRITPGILLGAFAATFLAAKLSTVLLRDFFIVFIFYVATRQLFNIQSKVSRSIPGGAGMFAAGGVIGALSSLVGIGGGTLSVPFMTRCHIKLHDAIGTSAALGFPLALAGTLGYVLNGLAVRDLPCGSLGFVYLPALAGLVVASMLVAPYGVRAAHALPVSTLKKVFALFLYAIGIKLLFSAV